MTRSAAEVEAEVEASRNELDRNVEALKSKMTPGQLFDDATRSMGGAGRRAASRLADQVRENPAPLAVVGVGLLWLMMRSRKSRYDDYRADYYAARDYGAGQDDGLRDKAHDLADRASDALSGVRDKASSALSSARDKLSTTTASAGESGRSALQGLSSAAGHVGERASQLRYQAQRSFSDSLESEPLMIGAIGLVVGAAIGAALPETDTENRLVGPARDKLVGKGKDLAQEGLHQAQSTAQNVYGAVKSELQHAQDGDLGERVEGAARAGAQALRSGVQSQTQTH